MEAIGILFEQHFRALLVHHVGDVRAQVEWIVRAAQAGDVAGAEHGDGGRGAADALDDDAALAMHHLDPAHHALAVVVRDDLGQVGALGLDPLGRGRMPLVLGRGCGGFEHEHHGNGGCQRELKHLKILERELKSTQCSVADDVWSASAHPTNVPSTPIFFYNAKCDAL
jgi:hypothetical protein